ncbi:MAG: HAD family phosphatase [Solirubrobacterales bacterium]|nr:HAD family phosphatase [Solirubrobacterales bacterium]
MPAELVIFDCDGVLIDSERLAIGLDVAMLADIGWPLSREEVIQRFIGRSFQHMLDQVEAQLGHPVDPAWSARWDQRYQELLAAELEVVDGVEAAVDAIQAAGHATCVASSSSHENLRRNLSNVDLHARFDGRIFSGYDVANGKPAPDLFLHAAKTLGFTPEQCVVVEDSRFGVAAARAAGMHCFAYAGGGMIPVADLEGPGTTVFQTMAELPELIRGR